MSDEVKRRSYSSPLREQHARDTRRRIRDAGDGLFRERGYAKTSIGDVAEAAGVSRQTVFDAFGSKAGLLKEVFDVRLAGDDEPVPLADRPEARRIMNATDPRDAIRKTAEFFVASSSRVVDLWPALLGEAATDAELSALATFYERGLLEGPTALVDVIAGLGALRKGRSRRKAKEAMYLLIHPSSTHAAFSFGWTEKEMVRWLTQCLEALLLEPAEG